MNLNEKYLDSYQNKTKEFNKLINEIHDYAVVFLNLSVF